LNLLVELDLLTHTDDKYIVSETAQTAILAAHSHESWANIAQEWRESFPVFNHLPRHIHEPGSIWAVHGLQPPDYFAQLKESPERARRFTRRLYEFHQPLAHELAEVLNLKGVRRLMDLGGGSGVVSLALLQQNPHLTSVIVDIEHVCEAGCEILMEHALSDRITYCSADFFSDALPGGFDMVLECDVCKYDEMLFRKLKDALNPGGRLVIVDQFALTQGALPPGRPIPWGFLRSLRNPDFTFPTASEIRTLLTQVGFDLLSETTLSSGWLVMEAGAIMK
jgi:predicted O-methyltransferase YrrM